MTYKKKQDRQCTYIATLRRVRAIIVAVERNKCYIFLVSVCRLKYPACHAHIVICGLFSCTIFFTYLINGTIFEKKNY
jgi:hypothetical protein